MPKIAALLFAVAGVASLAGSPARAESLACQTVNGQTTCLQGSGTLSCRTVNGRTTCTAEPSTSALPAPTRPPAAVPAVPPDLPDIRDMLSRQGLSIRQDGTMHIRTDGLDLDIE